LFLSSGLVSLFLKSYLDRNVVCLQIPKKGSTDDVPLITDQPVLRILHILDPSQLCKKNKNGDRAIAEHLNLDLLRSYALLLRNGLHLLLF
jgi:hypothetical protein